MHTQPAPTGRRRLTAIGVGIVVVVAATAYLAFNQSVAEFDPGSPEGVAQAYVQAIFDEDDVTARSFFTEQLKDDCTARDMTRNYHPAEARVTLDNVRTDGTTAYVTLTIEEQSDPFSSYAFDETLTLEQAGDGTWAISEPPWSVYHCEG